MRNKAFSFVELLVVVAIIGILGAILFPILAQVGASKITNKPNLKKIASAAIMYGNDYDDRIPILANGALRSLTNSMDGTLTVYGEQRTDQWPLLVLPYLKDRWVYQDPRRDDLHKIWMAPAHSTMDAGYDPYGASYRNQNRYPGFGVNYMFLSPMRPEPGVSSNRARTSSVSKSFNQATDPAKTIFYVTSMRGAVRLTQGRLPAQTDTSRGFFVVNAPGMYGLHKPEYNHVVFSNGTAGSGDWCGDYDVTTPGAQRSTNTAYIERKSGGNNVVFLDGHVKFMKDTEMAAGTNYLEAVPNGDNNQGGAVITDTKKYLWDLDGDFYGLYGSRRSGR